jgi:hypothetical protein
MHSFPPNRNCNSTYPVKGRRLPHSQVPCLWILSHDSPHITPIIPLERLLHVLDHLKGRCGVKIQNIRQEHKIHLT